MSAHATTRVLLVAPAHPDLAPDEAGSAAWHLHCALRAEPGFDPVLLACHDGATRLHGGTPFAGTGRPHEILFHAARPEPFLCTHSASTRVLQDFGDALDAIRPDILHLHDYRRIGIECLRVARNRLPNASIVLTLHDDTVLRTVDDRTPQDIALRDGFLKTHLGLVDRFVAPSEHLRSRYVDWGLEAERMEVIEHLAGGTAAGAYRPDPGRGLRLGYFGGIDEVGEIDENGGLGLLVDALESLPSAMAGRLRLTIDQVGPEPLSAPLAARIEALRGAGGPSISVHQVVSMAELEKVLCETDWLVVPARGRPGSPLSIVEARRHAVPVICADADDLREKVIHGETGLHFVAGRADSLARCLERIVAGGTQLRAGFAERIAMGVLQERDRHRHVDLYRRMPRLRPQPTGSHRGHEGGDAHVPLAA